MKCRCGGCNRIFDTPEYEFRCSKCDIFSKETAVNDNCKKCRLDADIQKEFGVEDDDKLRISIYREAWQEAEKGKTLLIEENDGLKEQILDLEQEIRDLKGVMNGIRHWLNKSIVHIDDWTNNED